MCRSGGRGLLLPASFRLVVFSPLGLRLPALNAYRMPFGVGEVGEPAVGDVERRIDEVDAFGLEIFVRVVGVSDTDDEGVGHFGAVVRNWLGRAALGDLEQNGVTEAKQRAVLA